MNIPESPTFDLEEYAERRTRLRERLAERGIDVLLVTSPSNVYWLTDYEASWFPPRLPVGVAVWADEDRMLFFDWSRHAEFIPYDALYHEAEFFDYGTAHLTVAAAIAARAPRARVALEWASPTPTPAIVNGIAKELDERGIEVRGGDWIVDGLRLRKSPAERERIWSAAAIADRTFFELQRHLRPGMRELEVAALVDALMSEQGGEVPAQHPLVSSGPTAWRDVHAFASPRRIQAGEVISIDASAVVDRYHVNLSRAFSLGGEHPAADRLLAAAEESLITLLAEARVGEDPAPAMAAAEATLRSMVGPEEVWWTGGYATGIAFPPSWVGHAYLANDGPERITLEVGYTSNFESVLRDRRSHYEVAAIDTVMATEEGLVTLTAVPRRLLPAG